MELKTSEILVRVHKAIMSRSTLDYYLFLYSYIIAHLPDSRGPLNFPLLLQMDREYVSLSFTNKHLVYYWPYAWRPDAPIHMVTTNGRFYTHGTHSALTRAT